MDRSDVRKDKPVYTAINEPAKLVPSKKDGEEGEKVGLKKEIGLVTACTLILGTMIGSGIFISPNIVLKHSGSVGVSLLVWAGSGMIALLGALCFAELGTSIPVSGGEFTYFLEAWGRSEKHPFIGPLPAFLFAWTSLAIVRPASLALITLSFATYALSPFYECGVPVYLTKLLAAIAICFLVTVNCVSVNYAARLQNFVTSIQLLALLIIIIGGATNIFRGKTGNLHRAFERFEGASELTFSNLVPAFYSGLWAFAGWNCVNNVVEELKNIGDLLRAILITIPLATMLFVFTNISYFTVMTPEELLASDAVAFTWAEGMLGRIAWIIPTFVALSTFGSGNGSCFGYGRVAFVAAREKFVPNFLCFVHITQHTPAPPIILMGILSLMMVLSSSIETLIVVNGFSKWAFFALSSLSLIIMRYTRRDMHRPIKVLLIVPILFLIISTYLLVAPVVNNPQPKYLVVLAVLLVGFLLYIPFVYLSYEPRFMVPFTKFCQLLLKVAPPEDESATGIIKRGMPQTQKRNCDVKETKISAINGSTEGNNRSHCYNLFRHKLRMPKK